jgi:integrase
MLPELRRHLVAWRLRSPHTGPDNLVVCTATAKAVAPEHLRRALATAKKTAKIEVEGRLSLHSLRHAFASYIVTDLGLAPTTAAEILGHADPSTTLRLYARDARDARDEATVVADVLARPQAPLARGGRLASCAGLPRL